MHHNKKYAYNHIMKYWILLKVTADYTVHLFNQLQDWRDSIPINVYVCLSWPFFGVAHCDDLLLWRPEAATVGCCQRQQHLWSHRNPYSRPEAAIFSCGRRPQDFLSHMSRQKSGRMVTIQLISNLGSMLNRESKVCLAIIGFYRC